MEELRLRIERVSARVDDLAREQAEAKRDCRDLDRRVEKVEMKLFWLSLAGSLAGGLIGAGAPVLARVIA